MCTYGTMAGRYYVLDAASGKVVRKIDCGEPIFSTPGGPRGPGVLRHARFSQVYAITPEGKTCWTWDFVQRVLKFPGDRWSGGDWLRHKQGRVTWRDQFCCPIDIAAHGRYLVVPAGGRILWLEDAGKEARLAATGRDSRLRRRRAAGAVRPVVGRRRGGLRAVASPRQLRPGGYPADGSDGKVQTDYVRGTRNRNQPARFDELLRGEHPRRERLPLPAAVRPGVLPPRSRA